MAQRVDSELLASPAYERALEIVRQLLGDDMAFDFDMLIDKAPGTETPTPFHQDMAYWVDLPDQRAADAGLPWTKPPWTTAACGSCRVRIDCRCGSIAGTASGGGALECDGNEAECVPVPLAPGSCTFHNGGVVHYSRGNSTAGHRRALIINFRPEAMIRLERERGFDHGKDAPGRENRNPLTR